jgi:hypothetical protein
MDLTNPPERYWHCVVELPGQKQPAIANDMSFAELQKAVVVPWRAGRAFTVAGTIVRAPDQVLKVRVVHTPQPQEHYATIHNERMRAQRVTDMATNRRALPFSAGHDVTFELLFDGVDQPAPEPDVALVERICRRIPQAARLLGSRARGKAPFAIADEYDVQDLLQAVLRAYLKYSVEEDPFPKVAGTKSGRADISIEELGVLIELKYASGPKDQKRLFEEFSQDLVLYTKWPHLTTLFYVVYNSADLRDPEALEKLSGPKTIDGRTFNVVVVLA